MDGWVPDYVGISRFHYFRDHDNNEFMNFAYTHLDFFIVRSLEFFVLTLRTLLGLTFGASVVHSMDPIM